MAIEALGVREDTGLGGKTGLGAPKTLSKGVAVISVQYWMTSSSVPSRFLLATVPGSPATHTTRRPDP